MKINERNVTNFASSRTPIDKDGYLFKKADSNKGFHKRWFVLKGNLLFYYEKKTDKDPIGVIILEGCTVELAENEEAYSFKLIFHGTGLRDYVFCADSQENMESWMKGLSCASYDYMKLLVAELQRQLDEIMESERQAALLSSSNNPPEKKSPSVKENGNVLNHEKLPKHQRFNPFDGMPSSSTFVEVPTSKADGKDQDILMPVTINKPHTDHKFTFHELHEYYGFTFRRLFKEYSKDRNSDNSEVQLTSGDQTCQK